MSAPEGWLPVEVTLTLHVNPTVDADGRHEVIVPEDGGSLRAWLSPEAFEARFGVPMPRPPEHTPTQFVESLIHAGRKGWDSTFDSPCAICGGVHVVIDPETEDRLNHLLDIIKERESLMRWKAEATEVIESWERVYEALGDPGELGQRRSDAALSEVLRMKAAQGLEDAEDAAIRAFIYGATGEDATR